MQSSLSEEKELQIANFPTFESMGDITKKRLRRFFTAYLIAYTLGGAFFTFSSSALMHGVAMGVVIPACGFLTFDLFGLLYFGLALTIWLFSIFLWFATGNVILPPLTWLALALLAGIYRHAYKLDVNDAEFLTVFSVPVIVFLLAVALYKSLLYFGQRRRKRLNVFLSSQVKIKSHKKRDNELSLNELQHMRLLLDRALQPVDQFEGFEWLDQFQTASVRYQINFLSYALSCAQYEYMPAFTGYMSKAQENLRLKQENHRIWKYWSLENLWGNFRVDANPICHENIMFSGFVAAQLSYAHQSHDSNVSGLNCRHPNGTEYNYSYSEIIETLVNQYKSSEYGLLACEPNWIYPLCNTITATAIRKHDVVFGTEHWNEIKDSFRNALETDFMTPSGHFVPFRSNYTGLAAPQIGGAVMQAFPCLFLNALLPDIAMRQWLVLKQDMKGKDWRRALWPIDVGNYSFSRGSSYAATALAARELGDDAVADFLLGCLIEECPMSGASSSYYTNASLWANANAFMAQINRQDTLRNIITTVKENPEREPYLKDVSYSEILVAKAVLSQGSLSFVLYPANGVQTSNTITIAGLVPNASYSFDGNTPQIFQANNDGNQSLNVIVDGRTEFQIKQLS